MLFGLCQIGYLPILPCCMVLMWRHWYIPPVCYPTSDCTITYQPFVVRLYQNILGQTN